MMSFSMVFLMKVHQTNERTKILTEDMRTFLLYPILALIQHKEYFNEKIDKIRFYKRLLQDITSSNKIGKKW